MNNLNTVVYVGLRMRQCYNFKDRWWNWGNCMIPMCHLIQLIIIRHFNHIKYNSSYSLIYLLTYLHLLHSIVFIWHARCEWCKSKRRRHGNRWSLRMMFLCSVLVCCQSAFYIAGTKLDLCTGIYQALYWINKNHFTLILPRMVWTYPSI